MAATPQIQDGRERLASAAETIAARLVPDPGQRCEQLGEIFLACEAAARSNPEAYRKALAAGELESFLMEEVKGQLRGERSQSFRGGWLGTYVDEGGRPVEAADGDDSTDREALELSARALKRALSMARAEGNDTLLRNLGWYQQRMAHRSYDAIAKSEGRVPATVRTGVARARKFVLRVVHELRHAQPAPLSGESPAELEPLRQLWFQQDLEQLARELEATRDENRSNPHWLNLAALLAADRGERAEAVRLYEQALVFGDAPSVRGRLLNNLGNLYDDHDCPLEAREHWLRAHQLVPFAPAPLLNLLAGASRAQDYASAQHYVAQLADLLNSGRLSSGERAYLARRLRENPKFAWLRDTDAWSQGPARWIRAEHASSGGLRSGAVATLGAVLLGLALLWPGSASAHVNSWVDARIVQADDGTWLVTRAKRGGDSMGKPARRFEPVDFVAGDSMGNKPRRPGGNPPRRDDSS